jgi:HCOMODA/2-hydroxy-3-carboxy-muconic semialdehyde decarboxylase
VLLWAAGTDLQASIQRPGLRENFAGALDMNQTFRASLLAFTYLCGVTLLSASSAWSQSKLTSVGPADPSLIDDLVAANRILAERGVLDGYGHISVRHSKDPGRFLMSRSLAPELVKAEDILEYDLNAVAVNPGGHSEYGERYIHAEIYKARPDVFAVVHSHTPSVIPFGVSSVKLRPVYHLGGFIGQGLPVFDIRDGFGATQMLVNEAPRGRELAQRLGSSAAVLMRGHGIAVVGSSLPIAVGRSIYIDLNARIQLQAIGLGGTIEYLHADEAQKVQDAGENAGYRRSWEVWRRQALGK